MIVTYDPTLANPSQCSSFNWATPLRKDQLGDTKKGSLKLFPDNFNYHCHCVTSQKTYVQGKKQYPEISSRYEKH